MNKPTLNYDQVNDVLYVVIREGEEHHFVETVEGVVVEFDERNQPIGIEILDASRMMAGVMRRDEPALAYAQT
jgi:uncharacterized protein YuzE